MSGAVSLLHGVDRDNYNSIKIPPSVILKEGNNDIYKMECVKSLLCPTAYEQE
jgi:hypothetical protein